MVDKRCGTCRWLDVPEVDGVRPCTIAREIGPAKRAGRVERAEALIWVLRLMSRAIQP